MSDERNIVASPGRNRSANILMRLLKRARDRGGTQSGEAKSFDLSDFDKPGGPRRHTYTAVLDEEEGDVSLVAILRGDRGKIRLSFEGDVIEGSLSYVTDIRITTVDDEFSGHVYNGTFDGEPLCHFFSEHVVTDGYYLWATGEGSYHQGEPPPFDLEYGLSATRTSP